VPHRSSLCRPRFSPHLQALLDYTTQGDSVALRVARDILTMGKKHFVVFGFDVCAKCYDTVHNISHKGRDNANKLLRMPQVDLETELSEPLFYVEPNHGRPALLQSRCEEWIERRMQTFACTTSRDGQTRYLPFRIKGSFMFNQFVAEEGSVASKETFRVAFKAVNATWGKPRYRSECKSCRSCWEWFSQLHMLRSQGKADQAAALEKELNEHLKLQYDERMVYWADRERAFAGTGGLGGVREECMMGDFTFPCPLPYLKQRTSLKDSLPKMLVGFGCLYDHAPLQFGGGSKFYFNFFAGCKDDANTVCSMFYHYLKFKSENGTLASGGLLNVQLDSASSNKCMTTIAFFAWVALKFNFVQVNASFLIAGHTGDIADAVTAHLRIGFRSNGNVWSWHVGFKERFSSTYAKTETSPQCFSFLDMEKTEQWEENSFNKEFDHHLYDFELFLLPISNRVSGFTERNVHRTEFSVHAWRFVVEPGRSNVMFSVRRLRSKSEAECPWSDAVPVFASTPDLRLEPGKLYFGDPRHKISTDVLPYAIRAGLDELNEIMPAMDKYAWGLLWQEIDQRKLVPVAEGAVVPKPLARKVKRVPRVVEMTEKLVLSVKPPIVVVVDSGPTPTPLETVEGIGGDQVVVRKPLVRTAANAGDEADLAEEADYESSSDLEDECESDEGNDEFGDNSDQVVVAVLGRRARTNGIEYLVQFENTRPGDGEVWVAEQRLGDQNAQAAIRRYLDERTRLDKAASKLFLKQLRGAAPIQETAMSTRSGKSK
jgi:hypothetical protein